MTSTELFRQRAAECRRLGAAARNTNDKKFWLGLVERWQALESRSQALENRSVRKPAGAKPQALTVARRHINTDSARVPNRTRGSLRGAIGTAIRAGSPGRARRHKAAGAMLSSPDGG